MLKAGECILNAHGRLPGDPWAGLLTTSRTLAKALLLETEAHLLTRRHSSSVLEKTIDTDEEHVAE